jgi:hypothetical protein
LGSTGSGSTPKFGEWDDFLEESVGRSDRSFTSKYSTPLRNKIGTAGRISLPR